MSGESDASLVRVVDYDPAWASRFESERDRLASALGAVARRIEHVGSTSLASREWESMQDRADAKTSIVNAIMQRAGDLG